MSGFYLKRLEMALPVEQRTRFSKSVTIATGDTSKEIMAADASTQYHVMNCVMTCITSAAQAVFVGDSSGTVKALSLAASFPQHSQASIQLLEGLALTLGEALVVKPAAAGVSFHVVCEGYLTKSTY
jgi:DMSO reductase anchor subunit